MKEIGIFVTGTDTDVGKTVVSAILMLYFKEIGASPGYMKPLASGCIKDNDRRLSPDVEFISKMVGWQENYSLVTPYCFGPPLAPIAAAEIENVVIDRFKILESYELLKKRYYPLVVEGIGGLMVPIYPGYLVIDLIVELELPLIVVARSGLGTINHSLLTIEMAKRAGLDVIGFFTNNTAPPSPDDPSMANNAKIISEWSGCPFLGEIPYYMKREAHEIWVNDLYKKLRKSINFELLRTRLGG